MSSPGGGGQLELLIAWNEPTPHEIAGLRRAAMHVGLVIDGPVIFFLYRFEDTTPWADAPYTFHRVPVAERSLPPAPLTPDTRAVLTVILLEARSGIVQVIRVVTLSPVLTQRLFEAIRQQAASPFDLGYYDAALDAIYENASSEDLARRAEWIEVAGL